MKKPTSAKHRSRRRHRNGMGSYGAMSYRAGIAEEIAQKTSGVPLVRDQPFCQPPARNEPVF